MSGYIIAGIAGGILFGVLDGVINATPMARRLFECYGPIARTSVNVPAGLAIDLAYGFILAALFLLLYPCLPGGAGVVKGASFGLMAWFLRGVMGAASQWMMFRMPLKTLAYILFSGLVEMLILGMFYGLVLHPANQVG